MVKWQQQRGAYIVTLALFMSAIVAILALALAFGLVVVNKVRLEASLDSAAMTALQAYLEEPFSGGGNSASSSRRSAAERTQYALDEAKNILNANDRKLISYNGRGAGLLSEDLGVLGNTSSVNYLRFGRYLVSANQASGTGCSSYPCYVWEAGSPQDPSTINALQIVVRTVGLKSLISRFANSVFGAPVSYNDLTTHVATARLDSRCVAFLLDVSRYTALDSHVNSQYREGNQAARPPVISDPANSALFAYSESGVSGYNPASGNPNTADAATTYERYHWASLCGAWGCNNTHRDSDYRPIDTQRGRFLIDNQNIAQPLGQLLGALNGAVQEHTRNSILSDKTFFYAYDSTIRDRVPSTGHLGATNDVRILAQLTNYQNFSDGVTVNRVVPNFVSRGWFPTAASPGANLPLALRTAMSDLESSCPIGERLIVVASSGMIDSGYNAQGNASTFTNFAQYSNFETSQLLGTTSSFNTNNRFTGSILADAIKQNIKISVLYAGSSVQPNFCNRGSYPYVSPFEAALSGFQSSPDTSCSTNPNTFFETLDVFHPVGRADLSGCSSGGSATACAWTYLGSSNKLGSSLIFRRPNYVLNRLAFETGGKACPIMPLGSANQYVAAGDSSMPPLLSQSNRAAGGAQTVAIERMNPTNMGAQCYDQSITRARVALGRDE